jgi:uncharacterized cupredoxin-like copper-binding protein
MSGFKKVWMVLVAATLLLTACGGQKATEVKITLKEFGIESSMTDFQVGVPYRFVVTNAGAVEHEIMLMPPVAADSMTMNMEDMDKKALAMIPASDLSAGATSSFDYTFTEATSQGSLEFACHTPGHYELGMKMPITVK